MSKPQHPTLEELALWVLDPNSKHLPSDLREHLGAPCDACATLVEDLRELAREVPTALRGRPSEDLIQRCRDLHPARVAASSLLLVAELVEDTRQLAGVRGEAADGRHLLFQAGEFDIDLRLRPAGARSRHEVRGQLHAPRHLSPGKVRVRMVCGDRTVGEAQTDPHGEFNFIATGSGALRLEFVGDRIRIRTPEIPA